MCVGRRKWFRYLSLDDDIKVDLKISSFVVCILDIILTRHKYCLYNKERGCHFMYIWCTEKSYTAGLNCSPRKVCLEGLLGPVWKHGFQEFLPFLPDKSGFFTAPKLDNVVYPEHLVSFWRPRTSGRERCLRPVPAKNPGTAAPILSVCCWRNGSASSLWLTGIKSLGSWCLVSSSSAPCIFFLCCFCFVPFTVSTTVCWAWVLSQPGSGSGISDREYLS